MYRREIKVGKYRDTVSVEPGSKPFCGSVSTDNFWVSSVQKILFALLTTLWVCRVSMSPKNNSVSGTTLQPELARRKDSRNLAFAFYFMFVVTVILGPYQEVAWTWRLYCATAIQHLDRVNFSKEGSSSTASK